MIKHALPFTRAIHIAVHVATLSKSPAGTFREDQRNSEDDR
jgi:hypothetical protein